MRKFYCLVILFLIVATNIVAQSEKTFDLSKLSEQDTLLSGWKFQAADNPQFANADYDDSKWQTVDPSIDVTKFSALKKSGIGWIRLHIKADSNSAKKQLTAWVFQYIASEIYLDGKLIKKYGTINNDPSNTIAFCPSADFFDLPLKPNTEQVISVRLAYQSGLPYCSPYFTPLSAFMMYVNDFRTVVSNYQQVNYFTSKAIILGGVFSGMVLIISIIYLFYFLFDRKQKVHLYYSISSAFFSILFFAFTIFNNNIQLLSLQMWAAYIIAIGFVCSSLYMLLTIYTLFGYQKRTVFKILILVGALTLVYTLLSDIAGFIVATNVFMGICFLDGIRASLWGIRNKKKGAAVILSGLIIATFLNIWSASIDQNSFFGMVLACLAILAFPLGMSVYLAIQNAITNQTLRSSLTDVQKLSAENILKEQEKQQILSNQNELLEQQVKERTSELNQSLQHLKSTQSQLIQSEKMASLGELTAGIAHEIQNPLNFVNNFSEVSNELIEEIQEERNKEQGTRDEQLQDEILNDIKQNLEKINHHGKRADAIVKGMLQHSRSSTGVKEPTDINALADEYLRLAYHGLRGKDKSFNAVLKTDFDSTIDKINIIPQDIGRMLLNLYTNAFYAVGERKKLLAVSYEPLVSVSTKKTQNQISITVSDNGNGIPQKIVDKIFQPFFTTKPTGQGTGLGLSLAYDIIKAHGGEIIVESKEGEGTKFIILFSVS